MELVDGGADCIRCKRICKALEKRNQLAASSAMPPLGDRHAPLSFLFMGFRVNCCDGAGKSGRSLSMRWGKTACFVQINAVLHPESIFYPPPPRYPPPLWFLFSYLSPPPPPLPASNAALLSSHAPIDT